VDINGKRNQRRLFTDGASMMYSGWGRTIFWLINLFLYALLNLYYLRVRIGEFPDLGGPYQSGALIPTLLAPLNIFEFPSYILVIGLVMAQICTVPILTAQLYNLLYALPFLVLVFFLGHNPVLTLCLGISCAAVSFEPLRFKSKFVAAVMSLVPIILYWGIFSGENPEQDALRWAVLYSPWALAFSISVVIFGVVLAIGHFLRYRPGVLMPIFGLLLAGTVLFFRSHIGMNERDFQDQVYRFSPGQIREFQSRSIRGYIEEELAQRQKQETYLTAETLMAQIRLEWRWAFNPGQKIPDNGVDAEGNPVSFAQQEALNFKWAQNRCWRYIDNFIQNHPQDKKVADAMYYKALVFDMKVDTRALRDEDMLRFYNDIPSMYSHSLWKEIVDHFGESEVSVEARWRLAYLSAGRNPQKRSDGVQFDEAIELLNKAEQQCQKALERRQEKPKKSWFWRSRIGLIFTPPPPTVSDEDLANLEKRIGKLKMVLDKENRQGDKLHLDRLQKFVSLDPYQQNYEDRLKELMLNAPQPDPLRDNIELRLALLEKDQNNKITRLTELIRQYPDRDGGLSAMLELAGILLEESKKSQHRSDRQNLHQEAMKLLQNIISIRPDSYLAREAQKFRQKEKNFLE